MSRKRARRDGRLVKWGKREQQQRERMTRREDLPKLWIGGRLLERTKITSMDLSYGPSTASDSERLASFDDLRAYLMIAALSPEDRALAEQERLLYGTMHIERVWSPDGQQLVTQYVPRERWHEFNHSAPEDANGRR